MDYTNNIRIVHEWTHTSTCLFALNINMMGLGCFFVLFFFNST